MAAERPPDGPVVVGAGRHVIGLWVDRGYCRADLERDPAALARRLGSGAAERWVGLMTGVALDEAAATVRERGGLKVASIVTVGLGTRSVGRGRAPAAGGDQRHRRGRGGAGGTGQRSRDATEAKVLVLVERGARIARGERASGTSSDVIAIAALPPPAEPVGLPWPYAGPVTTLGAPISQAVREAIAGRLPPPA